MEKLQENKLLLGLLGAGAPYCIEKYKYIYCCNWTSNERGGGSLRFGSARNQVELPFAIKMICVVSLAV